MEIKTVYRPAQVGDLYHYECSGFPILDRVTAVEGIGPEDSVKFTSGETRKQIDLQDVPWSRD